MWEIEIYEGVEEELLSFPPKILARTLKLLELMETHGANLGEPHTKAISDGLFEIRAKAKEGIGRVFYCYMVGKKITLLHAFIKKTQKTPKQNLELAKKRMAEVKDDE